MLFSIIFIRHIEGKLTSQRQNYHNIRKQAWNFWIVLVKEHVKVASSLQSLNIHFGRFLGMFQSYMQSNLPLKLLVRCRNGHCIKAIEASNMTVITEMRELETRF